jgi:hypothetical protein
MECHEICQIELMRQRFYRAIGNVFPDNVESKLDPPICELSHRSKQRSLVLDTV